MKKLLKILAVFIVVAVAVMQFFRPTFTNPEIVAGQTIEESVNVPAEVQMVLSRSCNDCHSNKTVYPWYSNITPFNYFLAGHIDHGREEMNLSEWNTYSAKKKAHKLEEVCEKVNGGEMPLPSYLWIHRDAALSPDQAKLLCDWAMAEKSKISLE